MHAKQVLYWWGSCSFESGASHQGIVNQGKQPAFPGLSWNCRESQMLLGKRCGETCQVSCLVPSGSLAGSSWQQDAVLDSAANRSLGICQTVGMVISLVGGKPALAIDTLILNVSRIN